MTIIISPKDQALIFSCAEYAYPDEGAGFLLGSDKHGIRKVLSVYQMPNIREKEARHDRFLISPEDYLKAEFEAENKHLDVIGVFHSHPDSPNHPSRYDQEWAQPYFSYIITSVYKKKAVESKSWRLSDDRSKFLEEIIEVKETIISE